MSTIGASTTGIRPRRALPSFFLLISASPAPVVGFTTKHHRSIIEASLEHHPYLIDAFFQAVGTFWDMSRTLCFCFCLYSYLFLGIKAKVSHAIY